MASQVQYLLLLTISYCLLCGINSDDVTKYIKKFGYPFEVHSVITNDGYILGMHRIPFSPFRNDSQTNRKSVLLLHGLFSSAVDWVLGGPKISLAYQLSDAGYDVWMANCRGNSYSKKHISISNKSNKFWNFSLDEIGTIDVPAQIDYVLNITKESKLFILGYSQGVTVLLIALSRLPEYNSKIKRAILLAPSVYLNTYFYIPILRDKGISSVLLNITASFDTFEFLGQPQITHIRDHCRPTDNTKYFFQLCSFLISFIAGESEHMNLKLLEQVTDTFPGGSSSKQALHYLQFVLSGKFRSFDYQQKNRKYYGRKTPPDYDLNKVITPIAVFYGSKDKLVVPKDAEDLVKDLKNVIGVFKVDGWNHFDFAYATENYEVVNSKIIQIYGNFSEK